MAGADWIVVRQEGLTFECKRCGARDALQLPASIPVWLAAARAFEKVHRRCKARGDARPLG